MTTDTQELARYHRRAARRWLRERRAHLRRGLMSTAMFSEREALSHLDQARIYRAQLRAEAA